LQFAPLSEEELELRERRNRSVVPNAVYVVANAPEVSRYQTELMLAIFEGLDRRAVELTILQYAILARNEYCWGHHVPLALDLGFTVEQLRDLRDGKTDSFVPEDRELLAYVAAAVEYRVTDVEWEPVRRRFTSEELVKLTMIPGFYSLTGITAAAFDIE